MHVPLRPEIVCTVNISVKSQDALDRQNRWASNFLSPVFIHFVPPLGKLLQRLLALEHLLGSIPPLLLSQQHAGPRQPNSGTPTEEWPSAGSPCHGRARILTPRCHWGRACPTKLSDGSCVLF